MKILIQKNNYPDLIKGASLFTCGGGIPIEHQIKTLKSIKEFKAQLVSPEDLPDSGYVCTSAELGPTNVPPISKAKIIKRMIEIIVRTTGKNIIGLFPPEIGQESVLLEASHYLNLPIVDFDPVGFRAVPLVDINIFTLRNIPFCYTPMVVGNDQQEIFLVEGCIPDSRLEVILRTMTTLSKSGSVFLLGGVLPVLTLKKIKNRKLINHSYSQALEYGRLKNLNDLFRHLKPKLVLDVRVIKIRSFERKGFFAENITVKDKHGKRYTLVILNEVLFLLDNNYNIVSSVPERILLIDPSKIVGISCTNLSKQRELLIIVVDPMDAWKTRKAQRIFGIKRFQFLLDLLNTNNREL